MKIKEVAKECGVSAKTIRYYETMGLLDIDREENGYREFGEEQVKRIKEICLFRSLDISVEDIKDYYEGVYSLDGFLGAQLEKQQEKIYQLEESKAFMLKLQHKQGMDLSDLYEERRQTKGYRNDNQEFEKQYLSRTRRGKQWFFIGLVWALALGFLFEVSVVIEPENYAVFGWFALVVVIIAYVLSLILWFYHMPRRFFLKVFYVLAAIESFPEVLDEKLETYISWYWPRKFIALILSLVIMFGGLSLFLWIASMLF